MTLDTLQDNSLSNNKYITLDKVNSKIASLLTKLYAYLTAMFGITVLPLKRDGLI